MNSHDPSSASPFCHSVGLLVFLILFQQALFGGLVTSFIGAVDNQNAPVLAFGDQARSNVEASLIFPGLDEQITAVPSAAATVPIGENTFTVDAGNENQDAAIFGYVLGGLGEPTSLIEGRPPTGPGEGVTSFCVLAKQAIDPTAQVLPSLIGVQPDDGVDPAALATLITNEVDGIKALTRQQAIDQNPGHRA